MSRLCVEIFLSDSTQETLLGNPSVFQEISGGEHVYEEEGERRGGREYQDFPWKQILSHSAENFCRGTL